MQTHEIELVTGRQKTVVDLTSEVERFCADKGDGLVSVFVPHATAGVALTEAGPSNISDLIDSLDRILPPDPSLWRHDHGTPGHGRDHVVPAFVGSSVTIPVEEGMPRLGTWQSVLLVDTNVDNPSRRVILSFIAG